MRSLLVGAVLVFGASLGGCGGTTGPECEKFIASIEEMCKEAPETAKERCDAQKQAIAEWERTDMSKLEEQCKETNAKLAELKELIKATAAPGDKLPDTASPVKDEAK